MTSRVGLERSRVATAAVLGREALSRLLPWSRSVDGSTGGREHGTAGRARPAHRRGGASAAGHQRLRAGRRTGRPDAGVAAADQTPSGPTRGTAWPPTRRPARKPGAPYGSARRRPPGGLTGWVRFAAGGLPGPLRGLMLERVAHQTAPRGLAAGQATQVVSHGRHHHNRLSVVRVPSFKGLNAPAGSPQNRHSGPPPAGPSIHPAVLAVAACIPSNLGVRLTPRTPCSALVSRRASVARDPRSRPTLPRSCCGQVVTRSQARCAQAGARMQQRGRLFRGRPRPCEYAILPRPAAEQCREERPSPGAWGSCLPRRGLGRSREPDGYPL
jgi:hypothetical protein